MDYQGLRPKRPTQHSPIAGSLAEDFQDETHRLCPLPDALTCGVVYRRGVYEAQSFVR
jgi:hypothetical protein